MCQKWIEREISILACDLYLSKITVGGGRERGQCLFTQRKSIAKCVRLLPNVFQNGTKVTYTQASIQYAVKRLNPIHIAVKFLANDAVVVSI